MPPLPKPKTAPAKASRPSTGRRERVSGEESSSAPKRDAAPRSRISKADVLQDQLARMYMMVGTMVMPFGRFYPVLGPIGQNLRDMSSEAAEAWMELGAKDKRVLEMLESIVGASTWGNVIGIHLAIFASALPGGGYISQVTQPQQPSGGDPVMDEFFRQGRAAGLSDDEILQAARQAGARVDFEATPARETSTGGPGDTVRTGGVATRSGIVSPEELGVTQAGPDGTFPTDASPPNGRG